MGQVVLRIVEGAGAAQFARHLAVRFYLLEHAFLRQRVDNLPRYVQISHIECERDGLRVESDAVIVGGCGFVLALLAGQEPVEQFAEPCLQLL